MTPEQLAKQRERRKANGNASTHRYERTRGGKLMRLYRNMQSRVTGVQWRKRHLYAGKELLSKDEFYAWAKQHPDFGRLYDAWVESGYARALAPTVDRIDSSKGYTLDNMRWLTHSENSSLGARAPRRKTQ